MREKTLKYAFIAVSALLLIVMTLVSRNAGVTCDEVLHYDHSVSVYNFFATHGNDRSALNTPETHLKYYGQSYDNLVTILIKWFGIDDVYRFRHLMSAFAGWLTILVAGLFAVWLWDYRTGIIVLLLFSVSPTFLGHSQNNLKDIPFALAYISSVFFSVRLLFREGKRNIPDIVFLTVSLAFAISVRAGGLVLICYLFFFFFVIHLINYIGTRRWDLREILKGLMLLTGISILSFFLSIILWPYAQEHPVKNVLESYKVMSGFPSTFREIFEGKAEWTDFMPWYYLIKSMAITFPLVVMTGLLLSAVYMKQIWKSQNRLKILFMAFTVLFPVIFVIIKDSNIYSSWRQFLFVYPGIILISAAGFSCLFKSVRKRYLTGVLIALFAVLCFHPFKFMALNPQYWYIYYNQLVGGLKGAYGNYETDYYYVSQTEASGWLINYLRQKGETRDLKVKATYSVNWAFRNYPGISTSYFRFEERSFYDWDYAIAVSRYISPYKLKNGSWPPEDAIHVVYVDSVPLCAVFKRRSKNDFYGYEALQKGKPGEAIKFFEYALMENDKDEMIFYNFAAALIAGGQMERADSVLKAGLKVNPGCELIMMYLGNLAKWNQKPGEAKIWYEKLITINRKYFDAYVELSKLYAGEDVKRSRSILRRCLEINPHFKPAVIALADTYRNSDPEVAAKYDELARRME